MDDYTLPKITIKYNGLFDFDGLYSAVIDWAKINGFRWHEVDYKHKVPGPTGAEQEYKWEMQKDVTDFIHYFIRFTIHSWDMLEVQVEQDGRKRNLTNARLYIWIEGFVKVDWQKRFKGGKVAETFGKWYGKMMSRNIEVEHVDTLYYRIWNLHAIMKKYFDMQTKKYAYKGYLKEH